MKLFFRPLCRVACWLLTSKCLLAMRLTMILLTAAVLQGAAKGNAQTVTISLKNAPLQKVFTEIEKQTGYTFLYTDQMLENKQPVDIAVNNATLQIALDLCFKNQPLGYTIVNKTIILKPLGAGQTNQTPNTEITNVSTIDVSGKITNENGEPVIATITVKGTRNATTSNEKGFFIIKGVDENAVLIITAANIETREIKVNGKSDLAAIAVKIKIGELEGVTIERGYFTEKEKTSVSNVVKITAKDIEKQPVQNVLLATQGRVPGLFVTQGSGNAGGNLKVRIQGENSIANGSDPLYVVDGVPIDAQLPSTGIDYILGTGPLAGVFNGKGNPLNFLNPLDIESVEILKDADATAIYGSRAANGAILITTKKGKAGAMKFDLNMETGWGRMTRRVDMMNTRQYLDMRYEAFANDGINWRDQSVSANDLKVWDTTSYTNWQDELLGGIARYNNINASVSGGSANMRYLLSGTYHKETTVLPLPGDFADEKAAVHFNLNANNNNQKFRMQFSGNYMFDDNQLPWMDITQTALTLEPNAPPLLNADGSINWAPDANGNTTLGSANVMVQRYTKYINLTHNLVSSLRLDYTILPGLNIGSSFGYNYMQTNDFSPSPLIAIAPELRATTQRGAAFGDRNIQSWIIEPQASYRTKIKKGSLDLLIGSTFQNRKAVSGYMYGSGQPSDELLDNINAAANVSKGSSISSKYKYNALFGRANYNWDDKYIISMNARRDGSTRFGADNRFHNFGSVGAAWLFSNESFFKSKFDFVSFGKLRGNYGTTGSDQIGDYQFMSLYSFNSYSVPYQGIVGLLPSGLPNPNLQWEETKKLQLGVDLGFWQDKLIVNANYVRNRSFNQLLSYSLPRPAGFTNYLVNFPATVQNRNWEFIVTGKIIQKKNFTWTSVVNLTIPQNKLIEFPGLANSTYSNQLVIGEPVDIKRLYRWLSIAAGTGDNLYADNNGHLTISPDPNNDRNVYFSLFPKFYGGFQNSISNNGIQLDFIFQIVKQTGVNDVAIGNGFLRYPGMFAAGVSNQPRTVLDRWQKPGDNASVARYSTYTVPYIISSSRRFADASYISLKNISLSWDLPQKWVSKAHFRNSRIYMHGQNLFMLTKYKGLNPETQSMTTLPPLRVWTVGVQAGL